MGTTRSTYGIRIPTPGFCSEIPVPHPREGLITLAHVIYALHALSVFTGMAHLSD